MENLTLPGGVTWVVGLGLRGFPTWGPTRQRRGQIPHPGGLWLLPRGRPRRGGLVRSTPVDRIPPVGAPPRRGGGPLVGRFFPAGVVPFAHPGRSPGDQLALTRGSTPPGRWVYLFGRSGWGVSPRWSRVPPVGEIPQPRRGRTYQTNYLAGLATLWGPTREVTRRVPTRVGTRRVTWKTNRVGTRLTHPVEKRSSCFSLLANPQRGSLFLPRDWTPPPGGSPRGGRFRRDPLTGGVQSRTNKYKRLALFSLLWYHKKIKASFFVRRPRRWRRKGTGKLARRYRTFGGDLRRRWRWFARPGGWRPRRRRRRWLRRRRKWLERKTYRQLRRNRRGRPRRGPPPGGFFGFIRSVRWSTGVKRFRRLRRLRRRGGLRGVLWTPRGVHRVQKNLHHRRRPPRGGRLTIRVRPPRGDPRRPRFWRFRSPRRRGRRFYPRGRIHTRRGRGVPAQVGWWTPRGTPGETVSRWGGKFISRGVSRGGLTRGVLRSHPAGVFQRINWLLRVGLGHHPRTRAGSLQRVASLGSPRGGSALVRKWLTKGISTRGDRNWTTRVVAELGHPTRAVRSREDYLKVAIAGGALL